MESLYNWCFERGVGKLDAYGVEVSAEFKVIPPKTSDRDHISSFSKDLHIYNLMERAEMVDSMFCRTDPDLVLRSQDRKQGILIVLARINTRSSLSAIFRRPDHRFSVANYDQHLQTGLHLLPRVSMYSIRVLR